MSKTPPPGKYRGRVRGFTLIELLITVTLLAVLLAIGIPSFTSIIATTRVKNASFDVFSSIVAARNEAITRNTTVTITPAGGTNWAAGWDVIATTGKPPDFKEWVKKQDAYSGITITGPATLVYTNTGRVAAGSAPTISLTAADVSSDNSRCITIDLSGRPVVAKGVCP